MRRLLGTPAANGRQSSYARRVATALVAGLFVAVLFGTAHDHRADDARAATSAVSRSGAPAAPPVAGLTARTNALLSVGRPIAESRTALAGLCAVASLLFAAGVFHRRATRRADRHFHFDAVFALRRGPPVLLAAV